MTRIIGFAGRKGAGKDTLAKFLCRNASALFGVPVEQRTFTSMTPEGPVTKTYRIRQGVHARRYAMADELKRICVRLYGLSEAQVWGTEEDKNTLTPYRWEDMPHWCALRVGQMAVAHDAHAAALARLHPVVRPFRRFLGRVLPKRYGWEALLPPPRTGRMTAREFMQEMGSGILRRIHTDCHADACLAAIRADAADLALVTDIRFPNESAAIFAAGGLVIRLTRSVAADTHVSESLEGVQAHCEIDNARLSLPDTCRQLVEFLATQGWADRTAGLACVDADFGQEVA
jgi:hypothetical protein